MTEDLRNTPEWRETKDRRKVVRPSRRMLCWLTVAYVALLAASVVQWVMP